MSQHLQVDSIAARVRAGGVMLPGNVFAPVLLKGQDALDLIHRISTNDLRRCKPGTPVSTVFTTEKGRVIDRVEAVRLGEVVWLICHEQAAAPVREWINRYIIAEDVEVVDVTHLHTVCSLVYSEPISTVFNAGGDAGAGIIGQWDSRFGPFSLRRYLLTSEVQPSVEGALGTAGIGMLTEREYHALRVFAGIPSYPEELNDAHNPLESGLRGDISFTKGCYIGQEVIARLDSYDKVQRELVVLCVDAGDTEIPDGAEIRSEDGAVGVVTSVGGSIGTAGAVNVMGYVARATMERTDALTVQTAAGPRPARRHVPAGADDRSGSTMA